jgi:hypothetical protein
MKRVRRNWKVAGFALIVCILVPIFASSVASGSSKKHKISFEMVRSATVEDAGSNCLPDAGADVSIKSLGQVEMMKVRVKGLPAKTDFDFFVIQVPNGPFGLSWYQGDIKTNGKGRGRGTFVGRFNIETFIVAPDTAPAPVVHQSDANSNPPTRPVHTFHLGLWFDDPADAAKTGCLQDTVTPFNGDHTAGVQVLSTKNFADDKGPLQTLSP